MGNKKDNRRQVANAVIQGCSPDTLPVKWELDIPEGAQLRFLEPESNPLFRIHHKQEGEPEKAYCVGCDLGSPDGDAVAYGYYNRKDGTYTPVIVDYMKREEDDLSMKDFAEIEAKIHALAEQMRETGMSIDIETARERVNAAIQGLEFPKLDDLLTDGIKPGMFSGVGKSVQMIVGHAGVGVSRLMQQLRNQIDEGNVLVNPFSDLEMSREDYENRLKQAVTEYNPVKHKEPKYIHTPFGMKRNRKYDRT